MAGFLGNLLRLPGRIARIERRLEEAIAYFAARSHPTQFASAIHLGDDTALALLDRRLLVFVDTSDTLVAPALLMHGAWQAEALGAFRRMLRPGDTVLDLGAGFGVFSLAAAEAVGPAGRVHAFEPDQHHAGLLARSIAANGFTGRVEVHRLALGRVARDGWLGDPDAGIDVARFGAESLAAGALEALHAVLARSPEARLLLEWPAGAAEPAAMAALAALAAIGFRCWSIGAEGALAPLEAQAAAAAAAAGGPRRIIAARVNPA
jgi:hypothetical protein